MLLPFSRAKYRILVNVREKIFITICFFILQFVGCLSIIHAHPMPNTEIGIGLDDASVRLEVKIPVPELLLAFPKSEPITAENLLTDSRGFVENYFREHLKILSKDGVEQPYDIKSLAIAKSTDEFVGEYQEFVLRIETRVREGFTPHDFVLQYDAVIHQVPNHFALVKITSDFNNGITGEEKAVEVGAIRYDFPTQKVPPFVIGTANKGKLNGLLNMVAVGMNHILRGFDHILFLLTLLIISPLAVSDGKWTLFQGLGYTVKRFLTISLAFTIGHSVSLIFGAFRILPINQKLIETLVAVSILLTALHAVKPFFNRRESFVALGFGLVHGIAFAEVLTSLDLTTTQMTLSILGFNLGIELMQIIIMAAAFPFLLISRYKIYDKIRVLFAVIAVVLACVWIVERVSEKTIIGL